jgi:hypothetical protein
MIWKIAKFYRTQNEKIIFECSSLISAMKFFNALNSENDNLELEIFFEDYLWDSILGEILVHFTIKSTEIHYVLQKIS